ncbi:hypothetical protein A2630_00040 [Candidatus Woesebacteria bacterium RIFCSPHIGHO2_01_FULL_44_10]|uniref:Haloacid dehalogenase n=1 Tax=Candidatus Woesebacteria bacterium RIFCSPLOWO2_01_FULL_44_14 TaxID=1802525 RepID=A0A1F8BXS8_9BACT|nr:MAG: hypothetical protein A2630_00040 [Candidatus Woesebacteria bacterium RIFCSPHIGHO2_01_FULL_44_10]OGM56264.1 MAG: hypothetical protein A3F62_03360 [Candidatus Woesebacteria bacterium RIFCSPHIGHO2_12_FULL_44_11]OGM68700.1 MAG: hypothetical protein A2975_05340 [Candidatus Woesebacteria bacterium RIFCSPLOWO2_01_FULL_44_14]
MKKTIIFDYDDTLVKTRQSKWDALKETAKRYYNLDVDEEHIRQYWGRPFQEMLTGTFKKVDSYENLQKHYFSVTNEFPMRAHADSVKTVNKLLKNYLVGILTASNRKLVTDDLTMLGFPIKKFFYIQTAEDTNVHKPDPKVFDPILAKLNKYKIRRSNIFYIGDSIKDYLAARGAGLNFIGITHGTTTSKEFENEGIKYVNSLKGLPVAIKNTFTPGV